MIPMYVYKMYLFLFELFYHCFSSTASLNLKVNKTKVKENQLNAFPDYFWNAIENCSRAKIFPVVYVMETEIICRSSVDFICNIP